MPRDTVLVLTQPHDFTADYVIVRLQERGVDVVRFDTGWFPRQSSLTAALDNNGAGMVATMTSAIGKSIDFTRVASIWHRRPRNFEFHDDLDPDAVAFARGEAMRGLGGVLRSVDCLWMNHPEKDISASFKPSQLASAAQLGLVIPNTLITNDPHEAKAFLSERPDSTIYKTLSVPHVTSDHYMSTALFTSRITPADLTAIDTVRYTPCLLQEFVRKAFEVRVTIIGDRLFAVSIHAPQPEVADWRSVMASLAYSDYHLPDAIAERTLSLVRKLGLMFAAIDFAVTPSGEHVFLELNPGGQWAWLEDKTGLPIADAIADCLAPFSAQHRGGT